MVVVFSKCKIRNRLKIFIFYSLTFNYELILMVIEYVQRSTTNEPCDADDSDEEENVTEVSHSHYTLKT